MPTPALKSNPTVARASSVWTAKFAGAVRTAAGDSGRLTPSKAAAMTGPYADNAQNYFTRTGKSWAKADTVIESGAHYVRAQADKVAGANGKLSLAEMRKLPADLVDDMLALRGKAPPAADIGSLDGLKSAVSATGIDVITDYGKSFDVANYPASSSREDILRDLIGYDDLSDTEASEWFSSTKGAAAVSDFASTIREIGAEERTNLDEDPGTITGEAMEKLFTDVAGQAEAVFLPASKFESLEYVEHTIAEDGDLEIRSLLAKKTDGSWLLLRYTDFPF